MTPDSFKARVLALMPALLRQAQSQANGAYLEGYHDAKLAAAAIAAEADTLREAAEGLRVALNEMFSLDEALLRDIYGPEFVLRAHEALATFTQATGART